MEYKTSGSAWDVISADETCDDCYDEGMAFSLLSRYGPNGGLFAFSLLRYPILFMQHIYVQCFNSFLCTCFGLLSDIEFVLDGIEMSSKNISSIDSLV
jgi:hypothetical protein